MRSPQSILAIVAFATTAIAGVLPSTQKRADNIPELDVKLTHIKDTVVKAVVTNNGDEDLTILNLNFFKDNAPVKKVAVYSQGAEVPFAGVRLRHKTSGLSPDVFTHLGPGESFEDEFDVAFTADLSQGGPVVVKAEGFASTTDTDGDTLSGVVHYKSNELEIDVDGKAAAKNFASLNQFSKRTRLTGCTGSRGRDTTRAIQDAAPMAARAAAAARSGGPTFTQYFKTNDQQVRNLVAARFDAIAQEASSTTNGRTTYYCDDPNDICSSNVLAYALPSRNIISNCPGYYSLSHLTSRCHGQDRVSTSIHEFTHTPGVFSPGTDDLGYGHEAAIALSTQEALNNADSFSLFANGTLLGQYP
ncbi:hypothetical protein EMPG_10230 [Blastomyces silverae]|uniref:Neutral protease 2 n=1 Tax=Blastomyces silverae TaxID=2060906 RepID=A0A0H1BB16_9EURO|nr:hypothetical protein EMPG_10230 [Blastomyces silverae]